MWRAGLGFVVLLAAGLGVVFAADEPADIKDHPKLVWWKIQTPGAREAKTKYDDVVAKARKEYDDVFQKLKAERDESLAQARRKLKDGLEDAMKVATKAGNLDEAVRIRDAKKGVEKGGKIPVLEEVIPKGAVEWHGHVYQLFGAVPGVAEAHKRCKEMDGHLVRVRSATQNRFLTRLTLKGTPGEYWLDGSDAAREGDWRYSNGRRMRYANWRRGEPNNWGGENWILLSAGDGRWNDMRADLGGRGFVCEWDRVRDAIAYVARLEREKRTGPDRAWNFTSVKARRAKTTYDRVARQARKKYSDGLTGIESERSRILKAAKEELLRALDAAIKAATKRGDLEEGLRLRDARKTIQPD